MLLRSSSTPVLGSLLSSISESPGNNSSHHSHAYEASPIMRHHPPTSFPHTRLSFHMSPGSLHRTNVSSSSSPASGISSHDSFRRAQSEDNLQELILDSSNDEFCTPDQHRKLSSRNKCFTLPTIPYFSYHSSSARYEEEDEESDMEGEEETAKFQEGAHAVNASMVVNNEVRSMSKMANSDEGRALQLASQDMLFAIGVGTNSSICGGGGGGGGGGRRGEFNHGGGGNGGESDDVEEYYRKMVEENPGNALFLRNYAQFLYEKRELPRAEEYCSRAILADPKDGEILSQYARIVWELHQDEGRTLSYHERAVQAAPQDSHVHAAYASFLWETEEDEDECDIPAIPQLQRAMASA